MGKTFFDGASYVRFERRGDGDVVAWSGDCNVSGAAVVVTKSQLEVGGEVSGTAVGCPPDGDAADAALTRLMTADPEWSLEGPRLTLRSGSERRLFTERPR